MRVPFNLVFTEDNDGQLEPKQRIRVSGIEFGPGVKFSKGVSFGGIDFVHFKGSDLEVETHGDLLVIKGIY
jgi:hypothetical protein